jgi:hypothetical protein
MRHGLIALAFPFLLAMPGLSAAAPGSLPAQSSSAAGLTVKATPRTLAGPVWEFELVFDTHTQDLNDDPAKTASLHAAGGAGAAPLAWQGDPPGGHHRKGVLRFKPLTPTPAALELRLQRAGEPSPRVFRWQVK